MNIYLYLFNYIKILCEYSSSKKLLDSDLESSTRVTRVTRHSPTEQLGRAPSFLLEPVKKMQTTESFQYKSLNATDNYYALRQKTWAKNFI